MGAKMHEKYASRSNCSGVFEVDVTAPFICSLAPPKSRIDTSLRPGAVTSWSAWQIFGLSTVCFGLMAVCEIGWRVLGIGAFIMGPFAFFVAVVLKVRGLVLKEQSLAFVAVPSRSWKGKSFLGCYLYFWCLAS